MGKLNVKSGVGTFQILTMEARRRYARGRGAGVGMEKGGRRRLSFLCPIR